MEIPWYPNFHLDSHAEAPASAWQRVKLCLQQDIRFNSDTLDIPKQELGNEMCKGYSSPTVEG
jgi:hypothetical protein